MKKVFKILISSFIIIIISIVLITFIFHIIKSKQEYKYLKENGYINLVNVGDYNLNMYKYGNENGKHKIIGLAGLGVNDYSVEMKYAMEGLEDNLFIFIDRAGYGYSDDTKVEQSIEQIVNDYRTALKNSGIEGPYVLMPHSLGGVYATYWENMYPDEIEGIILIDTSEINGIDIWDSDFNIEFSDIVGDVITDIGLQRLILHQYYYQLPSLYSKEDQKTSDYLNIHSFLTTAMLSERSKMNENTNKAYYSIKQNDIPKIYINANTGFTTREELREHINWMKNLKNGIKSVFLEDISDEKIDKMLLQFEDWRNTQVKPYVDSLGNTELIKLPGNHMIFEERPEELKQIIKEFLDKLDQEKDI